MVFAKVNGWEDTLFAQQWGVAGYPTLILMKSDGVEIDRIADFLHPEDLIRTINDYIAGRGTLEDLEQRYAKHTDSLPLLLAIGGKYRYRNLKAKAESCYAELVLVDQENTSDEAAQALHSLGVMAYVAGADRYDTAIARFHAVNTRYPTTWFAEDAMTYVPYIMAKQERYDEALSYYELFLKNYPQSSQADWARRQIDNIKKKGI